MVGGSVAMLGKRRVGCLAAPRAVMRVVLRVKMKVDE